MDFESFLPYIHRLAKRLVRFRRSAMLDEQDLASAAVSALWQKCREQSLDERRAKQVIKYAMLDALRSSNIAKMPRSTSISQAIQAYRQAAQPDAIDRAHFDDPIEAWENAELVRQIASKLDELARGDQILMSLIFEQELSFQEAAEVLGMTKSQVYHRYQAILAWVRRELGLSEASGRR